MTIQLYRQRNLNKTVAFLISNLSKDVLISGRPDLDADEQLAVSLQNLKNYEKAYSSLLCPVSEDSKYKLVFCKCCSSTKIFLRNESLIKSSYFDINDCNILKIPGFKNDTFLNFLEGKVTKKADLIIDVINELPDFFDAYLLLSEISTGIVHLETPISLYYYLITKVNKDIDCPDFVYDILNSILTDKKDRNIRLQFRESYKSIIENNMNLIGAFYYCSGQIEKARDVFESILRGGYENVKKSEFDSEYFYFYSLILYSAQDHLLKDFTDFVGDANTIDNLICTGIYKSSILEFDSAKSLFLEALEKIDSDRILYIPDLRCLIAHCLVKLNENEAAKKQLLEALNLSVNNFRILYMAAQEYFEMKNIPMSFWYCKKALERKDDGGIWKLLGRIYHQRAEYEQAIECFERAQGLREYDSLLYKADVYKKMSKTEKALEEYEKYVLVGEKNKNVVINYLIDYYEELGNVERSSYYRSILD